MNKSIVVCLAVAALCMPALAQDGNGMNARLGMFLISSSDASDIVGAGTAITIEKQLGGGRNGNPGYSRNIVLGSDPALGGSGTLRSARRTPGFSPQQLPVLGNPREQAQTGPRTRRWLTVAPKEEMHVKLNANSLVLLAAVLASISALPRPAESQSVVQQPSVEITTVGGTTTKGALIHLRFSQSYGLGQCPGLVYDALSADKPQFTLNVAGERHLFSYGEIKQIRIEWTESDVAGYMEPSFFVEDAGGRQYTAKASWLTSTSSSEASLTTDEGQVVALSARPDSKADRDKLIAQVQFKGYVSGIIKPCPDRVRELEADIGKLRNDFDGQKRLLEVSQSDVGQLKLGLVAAQEEKAKLTSQVEQLGVDGTGQADYIKRLKDYTVLLEKKLADYRNSPGRKR